MNNSLLDLFAYVHGCFIGLGICHCNGLSVTSQHIGFLELLHV